MFSFWKRKEKELEPANVTPLTINTPAKPLGVPPVNWGKVQEDFYQRLVAQEADFKAYVEHKFGGRTDKDFYTKVAGASKKNDDGTSRRIVIEDCKPKDMLLLVREADNPYDANAIKICTTLREQLGYVESRLAGEIVRDCAKYGLRYWFTFSHPNHHPETDRVVGATIHVARLKAEIADGRPNEFD